jgi:hypothetical protein
VPSFPRISGVWRHLLVALGGADRLLLSTSVSFRVDGATATAHVRLGAGQAAAFALGHGQMAGPQRAPWTAEEITDRLDDTLEGVTGTTATPGCAKPA